MMRPIGIVRKVDELGRVVIPIELRRSLKIDEKDPLEIYVAGEKIYLAQYKPACIFCGSTTDIVHFKGKNICRSCLKSAKEFVNNSAAG
jgi:AbrB family transcriptional regulator, transcriptional pleiotropic regulator of transition state genes